MTAHGAKEPWPEDRNERIAAIRGLVQEEIARRRALDPDRDEKAREEGSAARPADPLLCSRPLCRRAGACRPGPGQACADSPDERMRREICQHIEAARRRFAAARG